MGYPRVDELVDQRAAAAQVEIAAMAERARDQINIRLGFAVAFMNRSRGQRLRFARQRLLKGAGQ